MKFNLFIVFFFISFSCYANPIEIRGKVFFITEYGEELTFPGKNVNVQKKSCKHGETESDGSFKILCKDEVEVGDTIKLSVDKDGWTMLTPLNGEMTIAKNQNFKPIKIRLIINKSPLYNMLFSNKLEKKIKKKTYLYSVQVLATFNESEAIDLTNKLNDDAGKLGQASYYDKHLKNNMPNNGYLFKVKIGKLKTKEEAIALEKKVMKIYTKYNDLFITLEGY